jgi:uncharacterized OB-fold protein
MADEKPDETPILEMKCDVCGGTDYAKRYHCDACRGTGWKPTELGERTLMLIRRHLPRFLGVDN